MQRSGGKKTAPIHRHGSEAVPVQDQPDRHRLAVWIVIARIATLGVRVARRGHCPSKYVEVRP
jgi:hypothetical protein